MAKYIFHIGLFLLLHVLIISCENGLFDAGDTVEETYYFANGIDVLEIENVFDITLFHDTVNLAKVTCGENLVKYVDFSVTDNVLKLNHSLSEEWSRNYEKIKVELHVKFVPRINIRKPTRIETRDTFKTDQFVVIVWSKTAEVYATIDANLCILHTSFDDFGKYILKGKCNKTDLRPGGSAWLDCQDLETDTCSILQLSMANAYVNVAKSLTVEIKGTGNVYCKGNPDSIIINGQPSVGKLIRMGD